MGDSHSRKPGPGPDATSSSAPSSAASGKHATPKDEFAGRSGRIVHDERGNAVWDWIKETSRIAIDSTSRLLKRLEVPELKMEDTQKNNELSLEADRDAGGGYNPYGGSTSGSKSTAPRGGGSRGTASGSAVAQRLRGVLGLAQLGAAARPTHAPLGTAAAATWAVATTLTERASPASQAVSPPARSPLQVRIQPPHHSVIPQHTVGWLQHPVILIRKHEQFALDPSAL